jgi:hypothetical protein
VDHRPPTIPRARLAGRLAPLAGVTFVFASLLAGCALGGSTPQIQTRPTATPVPLALNFDSHLTSVVMRSSTEGWAVGFQYNNAPGQLLLLRYINGAWQKAPAPAIVCAPRVMVMVSATEGWIAGGLTDDYYAQGFMLHGVNGQWTPVALPAGTGKIMAMTMVSAAEGWAVAYSSDSQRSEILHYTQGAWSVQYIAPDNAELLSVSMDSASDGWAAGLGLAHGALWHYSEGTWTRVPLNDPQSADLESVVMVSATEGWGSGVLPLPYKPGDQAQSTGVAVWRYANGQWQVVKRDDTSRFIHLGAMQAISANEVWVSETSDNGAGFLHFANGSWLPVGAPIRDGLASIAMTSATSGWAVGAAGQIMRYAAGAWTDYPTGVHTN